jgi:hypothetical protein
VAPFGVASDWVLGMAEAVADGARFPPLILVNSKPGSDGDLVVLEGDVRLTAFMLCPDRLPTELGSCGALPAMTHIEGCGGRPAAALAVVIRSR